MGRFPFWLGGAAALTLFESSVAEAACEITDLAPTGTIPTTPSQPFSFVATNDCAVPAFSAQGGDITKMPRPGMMVGGDRAAVQRGAHHRRVERVASSDATTSRGRSARAVAEGRIAKRS